MNSIPAATVLVPVLNGEKTIGEMLVALKSQVPVHGGFEIVIVDNGSTDRTIEIVHSHGITPLHQSKRGPSAARNLGLAHAKADVIICIDSDCIPTRRMVLSLVTAIADPAVGIVNGPIHSWQPVTAAERYMSAKNTATQPVTIDDPPIPWSFGMHTTFRRKEGVELGGWDEAMGSGEDMDFSFRYHKHFGKPMRFVDEAILFHKHRSTDEALWRQTRWHGAGFALVQERHPDIINWSAFRTLLIYISFGLIFLARPVIWFCRMIRLITPERAIFENYHRLWLYNYWGGFLKERKRLK